MQKKETQRDKLQKIIDDKKKSIKSVESLVADYDEKISSQLRLSNGVGAAKVDFEKAMKYCSDLMDNKQKQVANLAKLKEELDELKKEYKNL